jgi:hypothetical protein
VIYLCTFVEIALLISCVATGRSWRGGHWLQAVTTSPRFGGPRRHPDASAAAYPTLQIGVTLFIGGGVMLMWRERLGFDRFFSLVVPDALAILGFAVTALSGWVYLFMRPAFLIPPPLRGATGAFSVSRRDPRP